MTAISAENKRRSGKAGSTHAFPVLGLHNYITAEKRTKICMVAIACLSHICATII